MGRRASPEVSQREAGGNESERHMGNPDKGIACEGSSGESRSFRSTLVNPKQSPSNSEYGISTVARGSFSPTSASASTTLFEMAPETTSWDIWSPSRSSQMERFDNTAKLLLSSASRALKRHAGKLSLTSSISLDKDEEGRPVWKLSGLGAAQQESVQSSLARKDTRKRTISAPFGFQHITHTHQEQVRGLERVSRNELISEFSAIRAGQRADPEIRGIKTQSLPTPKTPSSADSREPTPEAFGPRPNALSPGPQLCDQSQASSTCSSTTSDVRCSRAVGNFSRPVSRTSISPIQPPKRISSLNACTLLGGVSEDAADANDAGQCSRTYPQRTSPLVISSASSVVASSLPDQDGDIVPVGQAISTADDSARHLKASPLPRLPMDLDDVPEDEEGFVQSERRMSLTGRESTLLPLRHVQSFPSSRRRPSQSDRPAIDNGEAQGHTTSLDEGYMQPPVEDCLSNWPDSPKHQPSHDTKRFSIGLKPMCYTQDWELDVDYCYEHAAEAESDFNWDEQAVNFPVGLMPSVFSSSDTVEQSISQLHKLTGLGLHGRKHDSQESSVLSVAASIADISRSTNSVDSLPELNYSVNSSQESMDWEACHRRKRTSKPTRPSQPLSLAKNSKTPYTLFPSNVTTTTPPRTP